MEGRREWHPTSQWPQQSERVENWDVKEHVGEGARLERMECDAEMRGRDDLHMVNYMWV